MPSGRTRFRAHLDHTLVAIVQEDRGVFTASVDQVVEGQLRPSVRLLNRGFAEGLQAELAADDLVQRCLEHACSEPECWAEWRSGVLAAPAEPSPAPAGGGRDETRPITAAAPGPAAGAPEPAAPAGGSAEMRYTHDLAGRFTFVDPGVRPLLGYTQHEALGLTVQQLVAKEDQATLERIMRRALASGEAATSLLRFLHRSGEVVALEVTARVLAGTGGPAAVSGVARARTRHHRTRAEDYGRTLTELFDEAPIGLYRTTPEGRIVMVNRTLLRMLGYDSLDELRTRDLEQQIEPNYARADFRERLEREGEIRGLVATWTMRDGRQVAMRESTVVVRGPDGRTLYYDGALEQLPEGPEGPAGGGEPSS